MNKEKTNYEKKITSLCNIELTATNSGFAN